MKEPPGKIKSPMSKARFAFLNSLISAENRFADLKVDLVCMGLNLS
jgi:hypothetical protein